MESTHTWTTAYHTVLFLQEPTAPSAACGHALACSMNSKKLPLKAHPSFLQVHLATEDNRSKKLFCSKTPLGSHPGQWTSDNFPMHSAHALRIASALLMQEKVF